MVWFDTTSNQNIICGLAAALCDFIPNPKYRWIYLNLHIRNYVSCGPRELVKLTIWPLEWKRLDTTALGIIISFQKLVIIK